MTTQTHLNFNGQCEEAFIYYVRHLGGKIEFKMTWGESPMGAGTSSEYQGKWMHAKIKIGDQMVLGGDSPPERYEKPQGFCVMLNFTDPAAAEKAFRALGHKVTMPLTETHWAKVFGMCVDQFGVPWGINCPKM